MNEKSLDKIMWIMMAIGGTLVITGVSLILFTDIYLDNGVEGVAIIAGVIAAGLFLLLPSKIYLTLQLMKKRGRKRLDSSMN
jgi:hypothetical protein